MLTDKQTYYLQTMGIESWLMRHHTESIGSVMVVVEEKIRDDQQNKLLYAMFRSIGLSEDDVCFVEYVETNSFRKHLQRAKPRVIIALGCKVDVHENTPVITMQHPSNLLQHPINKKKAYADLGRVASCFMHDSNDKTSA